MWPQLFFPSEFVNAIIAASLLTSPSAPSHSDGDGFSGLFLNVASFSQLAFISTRRAPWFARNQGSIRVHDPLFPPSWGEGRCAGAATDNPTTPKCRWCKTEQKGRPGAQPSPPSRHTSPAAAPRALSLFQALCLAHPPELA